MQNGRNISTKLSLEWKPNVCAEIRFKNSVISFNAGTFNGIYKLVQVSSAHFCRLGAVITCFNSEGEFKYLRKYKI